MDRTLRLLLPVLMLGTSAPMSLRAQLDSVALGGPEESEAYLEGASSDERVHATATDWDVNDSLRLLPSYDTYCNWNTETIFQRSEHVPWSQTPLTLQLSSSACDHTMPICGALNSDFGPRRGRMHYGVDIDLNTGDAVACAFDGVVRISRYNKSFGNVVVVRHWNGLETLYAHLSTRRVEPGQLVEVGDTLGLGGSTGRSTGSHLHFEVRYLGRPLDPKFIYDLQEGELKTTTLQVSHGLFEAVSGVRSYHLVRKGESLSKIAARYGTTVRQLCRLNRLSTRSTLQVGQRLRYR